MFYILLVLDIISSRLIVTSGEYSTKTYVEIEESSCLKHQNNKYITYTGYLETYSGYVSFIYYDAKHTTDTIYINGGPGSSSQLVNYLEIGPEQYGTSEQQMNNTWIDFTNLFFMDLPAGTGFGTTQNKSMSIEGVVEDYKLVIKNFEEYCGKKLQNIHLVSTDIGSKFVIAIAENVGPQKIKAIALADPLIHSGFIVSEIPNYAYHLGLIDYQERQQIEKKMINLIGQIYKNQTGIIQKSVFLNSIIGSILLASGDVSPYNILNKSKKYSEDELHIQQYINTTIKEKYKFYTEFIGHSKTVSDCFDNEFLELNHLAFIKLLGNTQINILIYQSQLDLIIPPSATMRSLNEMNHEWVNNFYLSDIKNLTINNTHQGIIKRAGKLQYVMIKNCGQLIHRDQSKVAHELLKTYINE